MGNIVQYIMFVWLICTITYLLTSKAKISISLKKKILHIADTMGKPSNIAIINDIDSLRQYCDNKQ